jgi:hypothetical protein
VVPLQLLLTPVGPVYRLGVHGSLGETCIYFLPACLPAVADVATLP